MKWGEAGLPLWPPASRDFARTLSPNSTTAISGRLFDGVTEHAVRVAVRDQVDGAAVGRLEHLGGQFLLGMHVQPAVQARHAANVARDRPDVVRHDDDGHLLRQLLEELPHAENADASCKTGFIG